MNESRGERRSLSGYPVGERIIQSRDFIKGRIVTHVGEYAFSGFVRSIVVWTDGVRVYLDSGTLKICPRMQDKIVLDMHLAQQGDTH